MDTERTVPVALIVASLAVIATVAFRAAGTEGVAAVGLVLGVMLVVELVLGIAACYVTVSVMGSSFGVLGSAVLKLAAVMLSVTAVFLMMPNLLGLLAGLVTSIVLLMWLFELEFVEVFVFGLVLNLVRYLADATVAALF